MLLRSHTHPRSPRRATRPDPAPGLPGGRGDPIVRLPRPPPRRPPRPTTTRHRLNPTSARAPPLFADQPEPLFADCSGVAPHPRPSTGPPTGRGPGQPGQPGHGSRRPPERRGRRNWWSAPVLATISTASTKINTRRWRPANTIARARPPASISQPQRAALDAQPLIDQGRRAEGPTPRTVARSATPRVRRSPPGNITSPGRPRNGGSQTAPPTGRAKRDTGSPAIAPGQHHEPRKAPQWRQPDGPTHRSREARHRGSGGRPPGQYHEPREAAPKGRRTGGPLAHPPEPAYPCCLPALGRFTRMTPHEGSAVQSSPPGPILIPGPPPALRPPGDPGPKSSAISPRTPPADPEAGAIRYSRRRRTRLVA